MGTVPTGRMEREMRKYYLSWVKELPSHTKSPEELDSYVAEFKDRMTSLIEEMGGDIARLGVSEDFPAPKRLDLSLHAGTVYSEIDKAAIQAGISIGLNARDTALAIMRTSVNKEYYKVERLARTETVSAYWKNQWDEVEGLDLVMVWSPENGPRTCDECLRKDGLVVADKSIRDHPNGRCTLLPMLPNKVKYKGTLRADGSVTHDKNWMEPYKPKEVETKPHPLQYWVDKVGMKYSSEFGGKRTINQIQKALDTGDFSLIEDLQRKGKLAPNQVSTITNLWNSADVIPGSGSPVVKKAIKKTPVKKASVKRAAPKPAASNPPLSKLSERQLEVVSNYRENSFSFNNYIRTGQSISQGPLSAKDVAVLDEIMERAVIPRPTRVRRVIPADYAEEVLDKARSGKTYSDKAFMSTQKVSHGDLYDMIDDYAQGDDAVVLNINLPAGTPGLDITKYLQGVDPFFYDEGEILLPRNMKFKTSKPRKGADGEWHITLVPLK